MATVKAVKNKNQSISRLMDAIKYVTQDAKTLQIKGDGLGYNLVTGINCTAETAFHDFMLTKQQWGKVEERKDGRQFYQYVQSFDVKENASPELIHETGKQLAEYFKDFEVLVATHTDRKHIHSHLIVNSVSFENGKKLQFNESDLHKLRNFSDTLCKNAGLSVLAKYEKKKGSANLSEYWVSKEGSSWKDTLQFAIDEQLKVAKSKEQFINLMESKGYKVDWREGIKHILFTTPDDKKCRVYKLDERFSKESLEAYLINHTINYTELPPFVPKAQKSKQDNNNYIPQKVWLPKLKEVVYSALSKSTSTGGFAFELKSLGYDMKYMPHYKYMTFITPEGYRCRDMRLGDEALLKSSIEDRLCRPKLEEAICSAIRNSESFRGYILELEQMGYKVWCSSRFDHITYITRDGILIDDTRLDERFSKSALETVFNVNISESSVKDLLALGVVSGVSYLDSYAHNSQNDFDPSQYRIRKSKRSKKYRYAKVDKLVSHEDEYER